MISKLITLLWVCIVLAGFASSSSFAQEPKAVRAPKSSSAMAGKKPHVAVFSLTGTPTPVARKEPKDRKRFRPLPKEEKLAIAQGVHGMPKVSLASVTPFLTLSPSYMASVHPWGWLTLGWPEWIDVGLAHYTLSLGPNGESSSDAKALVGDEYVEINFEASGGNVYMVDFFVVIETEGNSDMGNRDFQLTISGQPPSMESGVSGGNHLLGVFYVPADGSYTARLQIRPTTNSAPYPHQGPWFFLAVEVTKFVPQA